MKEILLPCLTWALAVTAIGTDDASCSLGCNPRGESCDCPVTCWKCLMEHAIDKLALSSESSATVPSAETTKGKAKRLPAFDQISHGFKNEMEAVLHSLFR